MKPVAGTNGNNKHQRRKQDGSYKNKGSERGKGGATARAYIYLNDTAPTKKMLQPSVCIQRNYY